MAINRRYKIQTKKLWIKLLFKATATKAVLIFCESEIQNPVHNLNKFSKMKLFIITGILLILFIQCSPVQPQIVHAGQISEQNKTAAFNFAKSQFESCKTGKYIPLTTLNATPHLVSTLKISDMQNACEKINKDCGELSELKLQEVLTDKTSYIYRYKAKYSATTKEPEIRVYTNLNHKFDGLIYKPLWLDRYTPFTP